LSLCRFILGKNVELISLQTLQHLSCICQHRRRQACQPRHLDAIRLRSPTSFKLVQKYHLAFTLSSSYLVVLSTGQSFG